MGINDRCAVGACSNARKYKDKYVIKPHISAFNGSNELKFWTCPDPQFYAKWTFACNRRHFKFNKNSYICSNHFEYGRPTGVSPHPTLYLKGYDNDEEKSTPKRKQPKDREPLPLKSSKKRKVSKKVSTPTKVERAMTPSKEVKKEIISPGTSAFDFSVSIDLTSKLSTLSSASSPPPVASSFDTILSPNSIQTPSYTAAVNSSTVVDIPKHVKMLRMSWDCIKNNQHVIKLYTGCSSNKIFMFIADHVRPKHKKLQYYRRSKSSTNIVKQYQSSPTQLFCQRKPGPSRSLSLEDEILMTLMRIRLDSPVEDLAFRFGISPSHTSTIITTFILFLSLELEPLIYWPTPDETLSYKHHHFAGTFNKCEGIGDCTEQWIEHSKNVDAQYQTYSTYKSHNTLKKLIFCTKSGSISYISPAYAGSCTDRFITEDTNVAAKFTPGFTVLFDKGFNVQDLFLFRKVTCVLPPFVRSKRQFTRSEVYHGKRIARARIHVERVMGRLKEFRLLSNTLSISMIDLCDHIWTIAGAILNMQPPLVK